MNPTEKKSRPDILTWLCIGSSVFGVLWILMFLAMIIYSVRGDVPSGLFPGIAIEYLHEGYFFLTVVLFLTAVGITGVFLMWQMKKTGFYLYATVKAVIYFLPVLFIGSNQLNFPGLLITSIMITWYGIIFSVKRTST